MVPGWGFFLNNELTDFNLKPEGPKLGLELAPNDAAPGRRPRSSMAPTLLLKTISLLRAWVLREVPASSAPFFKPLSERLILLSLLNWLSKRHALPKLLPVMRPVLNRVGTPIS